MHGCRSVDDGPKLFLAQPVRCHVLREESKVSSLGVKTLRAATQHQQGVKALSKLDWLVHVNIFNNETGSFWKGPGMDPKKIKTEVFLLPCACSVEKEGSISNSGRLAQWRYKAVDPPGEAIA